MACQHRILLGARRPGVDPQACARHWHDAHPLVVRDIPHIAGYVQNRPLTGQAQNAGFSVCAESWFPSRELERAGYASAHYRDVVAPDEERFIDRAASWNSAVVGVEVLREGARRCLRVLAFGAEPGQLLAADCATRVEILHLHRAPPGQRRALALSAWLRDVDAARGLAARLSGLTLVTAPVAPLDPPEPGWRARSAAA
jgi:hypothetical protein